MTSFVSQVAAALREIPHALNCQSTLYVLGVGARECDCDREQRQAERVAAAIQAAHYEANVMIRGGFSLVEVVDSANARALAAEQLVALRRGMGRADLYYQPERDDKIRAALLAVLTQERET